MRFAFSGVYLTDSDEYVRGIEAAARCGYAGVTLSGYRGIRRRKPADILAEDEALRLAESVRRAGLAVPCLESHLNLLGFADLDAFSRLLGVARILGAPLLQVRGDAAVLREACARAQPHGVRLAHLIRHGPDPPGGPEVTRRLIERVNHTNFGAIWDPQHLFFEGRDYGIAGLRALGDRLFAVSVKDARRFDSPPAEPHFAFGGGFFAKRPLGEGEVEFVQVFRDLRRVGYEGWHLLKRERAPHEPYPIEEMACETLAAAQRIARRSEDRSTS
jgi:sugar phosphate isomerase/epimerase